LVEDETQILRFYLHISKKEQLARFSEADCSEREFWDDYIDAYEEALSRCSRDTVQQGQVQQGPWPVVRYPANLSGFVTSPWLGLSSTWKRYHAAKKE
jgi:polyphosphate kinase 2 (PPK2 family)